jgi:hypothetical protein
LRPALAIEPVIAPRKHDSIKFIILPLKVNTPRFIKFSTASSLVLEDYIKNAFRVNADKLKIAMKPLGY